MIKKVKVCNDQKKAQSEKELQKQRRERTKLTIRYIYNEKVQVGKDQEKAQSEKDSHSKNRGGKKPN